MTTAPNAAPAAQGAAVANMSQSETSVQGNPAPIVNNTPPAVTPPATQQKPQDQTQTQAKPTDQQQPAPLKIENLGHPSADAAIGIMNRAGMTQVDAQRVFGKAYETGKVEDIDQAYLTQKIGQQAAALVMAGIRDYNAQTGAQRTAAVQAVHGEVGGLENWKTIATWARSQEARSPEFQSQLNEYRKMLDLGGIAAKTAAAALKEAYLADPNNPGLANAAIVKGTNGAPIQGAPLTDRSEYLKLVKIAYNKNDLAEVARLNARREAGRAAGGN